MGFKLQQNTILKDENKKKLWEGHMQRAIASFGSLKTLIFACKTNSSTLKNTTQNAPKPTILKAKIKTFSGEGAQPSPQTPPPVGRGTPPPKPVPLGAYGASIFAPAALKLCAYGASFSSRLWLQHLNLIFSLIFHKYVKIRTKIGNFMQKW